MYLGSVLALGAIAIIMDAFGPWLLKKFFPQALSAAVPEVSARPAQRAARDDAIVAEAMANPNSPFPVNGLAPSNLVSDAPVRSFTPDPDVDYSQIVQDQREQEAALAAQAAEPQGVRDIFEDDMTGARA